MATHWASDAVAALQRGESCEIRPRGHSMKPIVLDDARVKLEPLKFDEPVEGDVVLVKVRGVVYLHLVNAVRGKDEDRQYQIRSAAGRINGWTNRACVYGRAAEIENNVWFTGNEILPGQPRPPKLVKAKDVTITQRSDVVPRKDAAKEAAEVARDEAKKLARSKGLK